ncbi:MAG TPA: hypothetical protein VHZ26_09865 [Caulobacteraceae bacterium]|jgi:hypothetical protein|nr:hypothetical protein [Caulobacteraceae bacterium]
MIPVFAIVQIAPRRGRRIRLWLPLFLVWLLLAVLGLLLSPLILIGCLIARLNPFAVIWSLARVFAALAGVNIEISSPDASVLVRVV